MQDPHFQEARQPPGTEGGSGAQRELRMDNPGGAITATLLSGGPALAQTQRSLLCPVGAAVAALPVSQVGTRPRRAAGQGATKGSEG